MQLTVERLHERLQSAALAETYFFHGEEPLQLMECADALRRRARQEGVEERLVFDGETGIDWAALEGESNALSLFASRRLLEIRLGSRKPDKLGVDVLARLAARPVGGDVLLVTADKADANTRKAKWFKALEEQAVCVNTRDLKSDALPAWLNRRAARHGKRLSPAAAALIADRVEGNMLAASQEVEKLCLLVDGGRDTIEADDVRQAVQDSARYDVFQLADAVLAGDLLRAVRIMRGLREEGTEPILVNWALGRELRQLAQIALACAAGARIEAQFERYRVWDNRKPLLRRLLERCSADELSTLLAYANFIDTVIKGARAGEPWDELEILALAVGGRSVAKGLMPRW